MAKKFIELIEAAALIILTAACVVGVMKHLDSHKDEPTEDTPIVEEVEILSLTIVDISGMEDSITISFEKGMTWREWVYSDYNELGLKLDDSEYYNCIVTFDGNYIYEMSNKPINEHISDSVIDVNLEYGYGC